MDSSIDFLIKQLLACPKNNSKYGIRATSIPDGSMKGRLVIEVVTKEGFRLLDLPRELRERIYGYTFHTSEKIEIRDAQWSTFRGNKCYKHYKVVSGTDFRNREAHPEQSWNHATAKWKDGPPSRLSLLRANKQIHAEATPAAYRANQFVFRAVIGNRLATFESTIGPSMKYVQEISLGNDTSPGRDLLSLKMLKGHLKHLGPATSLRRLYLLPDKLVLKWARQKAKDPGDPDSWACAFNKVVSNFLFGLKLSYKLSNRSCKAADVIQFLDSGKLSAQEKQLLAQFETSWREIARAYLEDDDEDDWLI